MSKKYHVHVTFKTLADSKGHAEVLVSELLRGKGISKDGPVPHNYEINAEEVK